MKKWKMGFRKIPQKIHAKLTNIGSNVVEVSVSATLSVEQLESGHYEHLGLSVTSVPNFGEREILPSSEVGKSSRRNLDGHEVVRKDLPKFRKFFYQDIPIYGDASRNGWATAAIPRMVYPRDFHPPKFHTILVRVVTTRNDGGVNVSFTVNRYFEKTSDDFEFDILEALNLLQENTGFADVNNPEQPDFVFEKTLNWTFFPPEQLDEAISDVLNSTISKNISEADVRSRFELFGLFKPKEFLRGMGGSDNYLGAKYSDDLVVFENLHHGNALYVLYDNWEQLSKRSRSELLKMNSSGFDRIVHSKGWEDRFKKLMQKELKDRGIQIRYRQNRRR